MPQSLEEQQRSARYADRFRKLLNRDTGDDHPSVVETILKSLENESNLYHVRKWKEFTVELERRLTLETIQTPNPPFSETPWKEFTAELEPQLAVASEETLDSASSQAQ